MKFTVIIVLTLSFILADGIVINEINYNSSDDFNPEDWVELHNASDGIVDISNWVFKDEDDDHNFTIPENTTLASGDFIVLCDDSSAFTSQFPAVSNFVGEIGFGFSGGGELLRLYDSDGTLIDTINYDDSDPWQEEPDGDGPTLELINPNLDNALAENWAASEEHGSPGSINTSFLLATDQLEIPDKFIVHNNYPNPFNPTTTINYELPVNNFVNVTIYDMVGRRVKTLVNQHLTAGKQSIVWNGTNEQAIPVAGGVYVYTIKVENSRKSGKIILLK